MRIVIVEDEADIGKLYAVLLETEGHHVHCLARARDALSRTVWEGVDVAIVDLMMPDVSGEEVLRYLAQHAPQVRRLVCSAINPPPEVRALADVVLPKPFSPQQLTEAIG